MTTPPSTPAFPPGTWTITPETTVTLTVKKLKLITVTATLRLLDGTVTIAPDGSPSAVTANIDAASFTSGNPKRDAHIASDDFLDSEMFPLITFEATDIDTNTTAARAKGTATIKDTKAPLDVTVTDITVNGATAALRATAVVDRNAVGIGKFPSFVIDSDVAITIHAHLTAD